MAGARQTLQSDGRSLPKPRYALAVSTYDRVASSILALILLVGASVLVLAVIVYTSRIFARQAAIPVTLTQVGGGSATPNTGIGRDPEPMGVEDGLELPQPQLEGALAAVSDAISDSQTSLSDETFEGDPLSSRGSGLGDSRDAGPGGEGIPERIPRTERWEIRFARENLQSYAKQLDYFRIELAMLGDDNRVHYASNVSEASPQKKTQSPELEDRLYMTWRSGPLQAADRELLSRAEISAKNGIILQFYPPEVENALSQIELAFAGARSINQIRKTIFGIKQQAEEYSFYVIEQKYFD